jgi:hypothetical protein
MADDIARNALRHAKALAGERQPWDSYWQRLAEVITPDNANITSGSNTTPDDRHIADQVDGTAMRANQTLANGQLARIRVSASPGPSEYAQKIPPTITAK